MRRVVGAVVVVLVVGMAGCEDRQDEARSKPKSKPAAQFEDELPKRTESADAGKLARVGVPEPVVFAASSPEAARFVGRWRLQNDGTTVAYFDLKATGDATKDHALHVPGNWEVVNGEARITWGDGWKDVFTVRGKDFIQTAYAPNTDWNGTHTHMTWAIRMDVKNEKRKP